MLETSVARLYASYHIFMKEESLSFIGAVFQAQNARILIIAISVLVASVSDVATIICAMMETSILQLVMQSLTAMFATV